MNTAALAHSAYAKAASISPMPRDTEYRAFAEAARRIADAREFNDLAQAVYLNRRLWTILATDVADDGNSLGQTLRAQIFYLSQFVAHQSSRVLQGAASPNILVEVNKSMMRGLRPGDGEV